MAIDLSDDLRRMYVDEGKTLTEIGEHFNLSPTTIMRKLKKIGVETRKEGPRFSVDIPEKELRQLYVKEGKTVVWLAKHFSCSERAVRKRLKMFDIKKRTKPADVLTQEYLQNKFNLGMSAYKIAEEVGFSVPIVY